MPRPPLWTEQEDAILREKRQQGVEFKYIAASMPGRSLHSCRQRYKWLSADDDGKKSMRAVQREKRQLAFEASGKRKIPPRANSLSVMPLQVFVDRAARAAAPRTITQVLFGDPPQGFSALDRREVRT
jgi:hypothetical protein